MCIGRMRSQFSKDDLMQKMFLLLPQIANHHIIAKNRNVNGMGYRNFSCVQCFIYLTKLSVFEEWGLKLPALRPLMSQFIRWVTPGRIFKLPALIHYRSLPHFRGTLSASASFSDRHELYALSFRLLIQSSRYFISCLYHRRMITAPRAHTHAEGDQNFSVAKRIVKITSFLWAAQSLPCRH